MKKLAILVPTYKETDEVVKPLLDSISIQQNIDFSEIEVVIVNDGTDVRLSDSLINGYNYDIRYILNEHKGVSGTRNACLDNTTAEYVMFCDADDMFMTANALWFLFKEMKNGEFDTLTSVFFEESVHPQTKEHFYITRGDAQRDGIDCTFVHGKVHRRMFLINNNIRWNESLTIHEDSFFNCLCQKCASPERAKYCPYPFYLWKWRDDSVCRRDPKYILKTLPNMVASSTALVEALISRGKKEDAKFYVTSMVMDCYYSINCKQWMAEENKEFKDKLEDCFREYYKKYKELFDTVQEQTKAQIVMGVRNRFFQEGLVLESITFEDWIKHIGE